MRKRIALIMGVIAGVAAANSTGLVPLKVDLKAPYESCFTKAGSVKLAHAWAQETREILRRVGCHGIAVEPRVTCRSFLRIPFLESCMEAVAGTAQCPAGLRLSGDTSLGTARVEATWPSVEPGAQSTLTHITDGAKFTWHMTTRATEWSSVQESSVATG